VSLLGVLAAASTGLFAGAAIYITAVEHPARLACGNALALRQFAPSYQRAAVMQASLAVLGALAGIAAWWLGSGVAFLLSALTIAAVVPFTLLVILPTNARLLSGDLDPESQEAARLLRRWGHLHAARSAAGMAAFLLALSA
jgi:hypothetical protein